MSNGVKVTFLARWNEFLAGDKTTVTHGQAEILLARGLIVAPGKKWQRDRTKIPKDKTK
jgi:hypothetical protein